MAFRVRAIQRPGGVRLPFVGTPLLSGKPAQAVVVQRLVILVSRDSAAVKNYENLVAASPGYTDPTGSLREGSADVQGPPLGQLGEMETLHIVSHGDGQGHIEGQDEKGASKQMTASEFLTFLIGAGLDPKKHKGAIRLVSCLSGTKTARGTTFAEDFTNALRSRGFSNAVIGFDGLVAVRDHASIGVVPPSKIKEHEMLTNVQVTLGEMHQRAAESLKEVSPKQRELVEQRKQYAADILAVRKQRIAEANALFEPQKIGKNIVYFPSGS
jgi:hypothetical protein